MPQHIFSFPAIGTHWAIELQTNLPKSEIEKEILSRIEEFDRTYSRFRKDSLVWQISKEPGKYKFPPDSREMFNLYEKLYQITGGSFSLLIGSALSEAGYDAEYSLTPKKINKLPKPEEIYSFDYPVLTVKKPHILDFGGVGKGYLIDIISNLLIENGINSFSIDAGGDIYCQGMEKPLRVGLENPKDEKQVIGVVEIMDKSICASSGNRRKWKEFHHIFDAKTLKPSNKIIGSWVIAENALIADAIATCLFLIPAEKLLKYFNFEYLILNPDFTVQKSNGFKAELFTKN